MDDTMNLYVFRFTLTAVSCLVVVSFATVTGSNSYSSVRQVTTTNGPAEPTASSRRWSDQEYVLRKSYYIEQHMRDCLGQFGIEVADLEQPLELAPISVYSSDTFKDDAGALHVRTLARFPSFVEATHNWPVQLITLAACTAAREKPKVTIDPATGVSLRIQPLFGRPQNGLQITEWTTAEEYVVWYWQPSRWPSALLRGMLESVGNGPELLDLPPETEVYVLDGEYTVTAKCEPKWAATTEGMLKNLCFWQCNGVWGVSPRLDCFNVLALVEGSSFLHIAAKFTVVGTSPSTLSLDVRLIGPDLEWPVSPTQGK